VRTPSLKFVLLGLATLVLAAVLTAVPYISPEHWDERVHLCVGIAYALGSAGALTGMLAFRAADRMRLAWLGVGGGVFFGLVKIGLWTAPLHNAPHSVPGPALFSVLVALTVVINVSCVWGLSIFVRAWTGTGMVPPWYRLAAIGAFAIGALIAGPSLVNDLRDSFGGKFFIGATISDFSDIICITLIGPLLATAIWMRGGLLVYPYLLLAASSAAWLSYDAGWRFAPQYGQVTDAFFSSLAVICIGAAGVAHRWVVDAAKTSI